MASAMVTTPTSPSELSLRFTVYSGDLVCLMASAMTDAPSPPIKLPRKSTSTSDLLCLMMSQRLGKSKTLANVWSKRIVDTWRIKRELRIECRSTRRLPLPTHDPIGRMLFTAADQSRHVAEM